MKVLECDTITIDASKSYDEYSVYKGIRLDEDLVFKWECEYKICSTTTDRQLIITDYDKTKDSIQVKLTISKSDGRTSTKLLNIQIIKKTQSITIDKLLKESKISKILSEK